MAIEKSGLWIFTYVGNHAAVPLLGSTLYSLVAQSIARAVRCFSLAAPISCNLKARFKRWAKAYEKTT